MKKKTNKHYVSPADRFLAEFNATHELSASQQAEVDKYNRLNELRDRPVDNEPKDDSKLWD